MRIQFNEIKIQLQNYIFQSNHKIKLSIGYKNFETFILLFLKWKIEIRSSERKMIGAGGMSGREHALKKKKTNYIESRPNMTAIDLITILILVQVNVFESSHSLHH